MVTQSRSWPADTVEACPDEPLADVVAELGWGLSTAVRAFRQWAIISVAELPGGPRAHQVLATIARDSPPSQLALANALDVDRTVMTYLLDDLEAAHLVERRPDPADRRARQVHITAAGSKALRLYGERLRQAEERLLAPLEPAEAAAFRGMVERVARAALAARQSGCPDSGTAC